jgi:hypothetical protein
MPASREQLTYQLLIELEEATPTIWRRLLVPTSARLPRLHDMIQVAMGWTDSHEHSFTVGDARYAMCLDDDREDEIDEETVTVLEALHGHREFSYEYDFGDGWEHTVTIEAEHRSPHGLQFALCLAGANACPPEDCGGPAGYERFLGALADPQNAQRRDYVRWIGRETFDRAAFDLIGVNAALQIVRERSSQGPTVGSFCRHVVHSVSSRSATVTSVQSSHQPMQGRPLGTTCF